MEAKLDCDKDQFDRRVEQFVAALLSNPNVVPSLESELVGWPEELIVATARSVAWALRDQETGEAERAADSEEYLRRRFLG